MYGRTLGEEQAIVVGLHCCDFGNDECYASSVGEATEVDRDFTVSVMTGNETRHHAGVEGGAVAVDQGDQSCRSELGTHGPATQHQGMAMSPPGQNEVISRHGLSAQHGVEAWHCVGS